MQIHHGAFPTLARKCLVLMGYWGAIDEELIERGEEGRGQKDLSEG